MHPLETINMLTESTMTDKYTLFTRSDQETACQTHPSVQNAHQNRALGLGKGWVGLE
jgi:hypothetical protein